MIKIGFLELEHNLAFSSQVGVLNALSSLWSANWKNFNFFKGSSDIFKGYLFNIVLENKLVALSYTPKCKQ